MKTKVFITKHGVILYEDENGVLTSSNMEAVKSALMDDINNDDLPFGIVLQAMEWVKTIIKQEANQQKSQI